VSKGFNMGAEHGAGEGAEEGPQHPAEDGAQHGAQDGLSWVAVLRDLSTTVYQSRETTVRSAHHRLPEPRNHCKLLQTVFRYKLVY
jgi:hypothetical protein